MLLFPSDVFGWSPDCSTVDGDGPWLLVGSFVFRVLFELDELVAPALTKYRIRELSRTRLEKLPLLALLLD